MLQGIKVISIDELRIGMFVQEVTSAAGLSVRSAGLVRSHQAMDSLIRGGVTTLVIDLDRSLTGMDEHEQHDGPVIADVSEPLEDLHFSQQPQTEIEQECEHSRELYQGTKQFVGQMMDRIRQGEGPDLADAGQLTDNIIRSVFRNESALLYISRLRHKDHYLMEHSVGVAILAAVFGRYLELPESDIQQLALGALLHDVGKTTTPKEVLHKPGKLNPDEFELMKQHALSSFFILEKMAGISDTVLEMAANHHERPDGKGYPNGLSGEQLSRFSRIMAIVDSYDAMTADRVYRKGMPPTAALRIMLEEAPHQLDEELLTSFIRCMGVYPVGTWVELESGRVGIVIERGSTPLTPKVKVVYDARRKKELLPGILSLEGAQDKIKTATLAGKYGLDITQSLY